MANVSKFPLLRLPILAIFEVLSTMNPFEIINFSMSSLRCKKIVRIFFRSKRKFRVSWFFHENPSISIRGNRNYFCYKFTSEEKKDNILQYYVEERENTEVFMKYSANIFESFFNLFKYIDDLMNFEKLETLHSEMCHFPFQNDLIAQETKNFNRPIELFNLYSPEDVGNDVIDMLNHMKGIKVIQLWVPFSKDFEMILPPALELLEFVDGNWIKLRHLLEFTSSEIKIHESKLTHLDLTSFFASWMSSESHLNLKRFEINIDNREVFENISRNLLHGEFDDDNIIPKISILPQDEVILGDFCIKRNDGKKGIIFLFHHELDPDCLMLGMIVG